MENEDKRPEVWVARRLMCRVKNDEPYTIAYFVSKAMIQSATTKFLKSGKQTKVYEVEYETPEEIKNLNFDGRNDIYVEMGDYVKKDRIFLNYSSATSYVESLNKKLELNKIDSASKLMIDETLEKIKRERLYAKMIERYFGRTRVNNVKGI